MNIKSWIWVIFIYSLWLVAVLSRPLVMQLSCIISCNPNFLLEIDTVALNLNNTLADQISYLSQNLSGMLLISLSIVWNLPLLKTFKHKFYSSLLFEMWLIAMVFAINGLATEIAHLMVQRPRPFVFIHPELFGSNPANYTSFYSGHTSYVAASQTLIFGMLYLKKAPFFYLMLSWIANSSWILITGYLRVMAGRHFFSDVVIGSIAGSLISFMILTYHQKKLNHFSIKDKTF